MKRIGFIREITFFGKERIVLDSDSTVVIIGPNNCGKTRSLLDIKSLLGTNQYKGDIITEIHFEKELNTSQLFDIMEPYKKEEDMYDLGNIGEMFSTGGISSVKVRELWKLKSSFIGKLVNFVIADLNTRVRLSDCDTQDSVPASKARLRMHPFQRMQYEPEIAARISAEFYDAFNLSLVVHHGGGRQVWLHVGQPPALAAGENQVALSYIEKVEELPRLDQQGDGVRSFASIIGRTITQDRPVQLIDEPEAFLHPPQARLVGSCITKNSVGRQTFIATHSREVLQGVLDGGHSKITVVRLQRSDHCPSAALLTSDLISRIWKDPILRFSNVLDGLFHHGVVVTEADADCRFYEAMSASLGGSAGQRMDIHYCHSGGKDRLPTIIKALKALNVPVAVIADFDILNNERPVRDVIEALGGDWHIVSSKWKKLSSDITSNTAFLDGNKFRSEISQLLKSFGTNTVVPKDTLTGIRKACRSANAWDVVKRAGLQGVASGEATLNALSLLKAFKEIGLFVVPVGDMEGFCRTIAVKGSRWVGEVIEKDLSSDDELEEARKFVFDLDNFLRLATGMARSAVVKHDAGRQITTSCRTVPAKTTDTRDNEGRTHWIWKLLRIRF